MDVATAVDRALRISAWRGAGAIAAAAAAGGGGGGEGTFREAAPRAPTLVLTMRVGIDNNCNNGQVIAID